MDCRKGTAVEGGGEIQGGDVVGRTGKKEEGEMWEEERSLSRRQTFTRVFHTRQMKGDTKL